MGGFHVRGYKYEPTGTPGLVDTQMYFHNWGGTVHNLQVVNNGNWAPVTVYVSIDNYVCLRFSDVSSDPMKNSAGSWSGGSGRYFDAGRCPRWCAVGELAGLVLQ